jgi:nicotinamide-nucleotide amidase
MNVSAIIIGDEILNGRTKDLNASWLTGYLFKQGMNLTSIRFIRDNTEEIIGALTQGIAEADVVITTGGIGPTLDDKTKNVMAYFFNKKIIERADVKKIIEKNYERFGRPWIPSMNHYHFFPEDFIATNNPKGLAPGIVYFESIKNKLIMCAPGVPNEFKYMMDEEFFPLIKKFLGNKLQPNLQTIIRTEGVPEEKIFGELCPNLWSDLEKFGKVSSLPHIVGIDIIVSYHGTVSKDSEIKKVIDATPLSKHVWHWGPEQLSELVLKKALEKKLTFSFAESCTGGLTASKITDLSGSSAVFMGSVVSYANEAKEYFLDVSNETLNNFGAVSIETAIEMATGAREKFNTDIAISITGIAGPTGGTEEKPVGTVVIGFATKTSSGATTYLMPGDRLRKKDRFSERALLTLLEHLQSAH